MTAGALDLAERFDAAAAWAALPADGRAAIGEAVLPRHAAQRVIEAAIAADDPVRERVGIAAEAIAEREFDALLEEIDIADPDTTAGLPRVPALLGMVCEGCGCSEQDACPNGCGWSRDGLCTACAGGAHAEP